MGIHSVMCMKGGDGESSYVMNSSLQAGAIQDSRSIVDEALIKLVYLANNNKLTIADLGCASGPNALSVMANMTDTIEQACQRQGRPTMELQFFLSDLPTNDFNSIFSSTQYDSVQGNTNLSRCFVAGVAGSFYHRLFPERNINFFHSSSSLHWLSQDPLKSWQDGQLINKGTIYISKRSPPTVTDAYSRQFKKDFSNFLRLRSVETIIGGRMVLTFIGRREWDVTSVEASRHCELLSVALMDMVEEGHILQEKVDSFNLPFYAPCLAEVAHEILSEGSFSMDFLKVYDADFNLEDEGTGLNLTRGQRMSKMLQAVLESQLASHFGSDIIGDLFSRFANLFDKSTSSKMPKMTYLVVSLVKEIPRTLA